MNTLQITWQRAYQRSDSYNEEYITRLHTLAPLPSVITRAKPQDVMVSPETKLHDFTNNLPVYVTRDRAMEMPSLRPTFDKPSGPALVDEFARLSTISSPDGRLNIIPMFAEGVQGKRYDPRNIPSDIQDYSILPMTITPDKESVPPGWEVCVHPEGCIYYFHEDVVIFEKDSWKIRVITQTDLAPHVAETIQALAEFACSHAFHNPSFPREVDLVLEPIDVGNTATAGYYFVHHENRCLFWLRKLDGTAIFRECSGVTKSSHKQIELEAQYWYAPRSTDAYCMTSEVSAVCAFSMDVLNNTLVLIKDMDVENECIHSAYDKCFIARMMNHFRHCQYLNYHGQQGARLSRDQSVHGETYQQRSVMMKCLAPLLFNAPYEHVHSLHKLYVDSIVNHLDWRTFVQKLNAEMQDFNLLATVLLNVNVGFLAIQSVDRGAGCSLSQVASYMSVISSFGSMLLGVKLARKSHARGPDMVDNAQAHLQSLVHPKHGLETLAIVYSLPYALLMWGMIFFVIAFFAECFHWSGVVPLVPVSVSSLIVLVLVLWSLQTLRASTLKDYQQGILAVLRKFSSGRQETDSRHQIEAV